MSTMKVRTTVLAARTGPISVTNRIIEEANLGERDPGHLCAWAIIQVGDSNVET
jgi:hypothetical protein